MQFYKKTEYRENEVLVYFVDADGRIQGTLKAYVIENDQPIRDEYLLYTQEYKDGEPTGEKIEQFY